MNLEQFPVPGGGQPNPERLSLYEMEVHDKKKKLNELSLREVTLRKPEDHRAHLEEVRGSIISPDFFDKILGMQVSLHNNEPRIKAASLENAFVRHFLHLSDGEIDEMVDELNIGYQKWLRANTELKNKRTGGRALEGVGDNPLIINKNLDQLKGIKAVVNYMHNRSEEFDSPSNSSSISFYFNDVLDATEQIDLVELVTTPGSTEGEVENAVTMNLVQIKAEHAAVMNTGNKVQETHRRFVLEKLWGAQELEEEFLDKAAQEGYDAAEQLVSQTRDDAILMIIDVAYSDDLDKEMKPEDRRKMIERKFKKALPILEANTNIRGYLLGKLSEGIDRIFSKEMLLESDGEAFDEAFTILQDLIKSAYDKSKIKGDIFNISKFYSIVATGEQRLIEEEIDLSGSERIASMPLTN